MWKVMLTECGECDARGWVSRWAWVSAGLALRCFRRFPKR